MQPGSNRLVALMRVHNREIFHLTHALLRDENAAEKITRQVFARAGRRLERDSSDVVEWLYYATFRFVRMYHWRSVGPMARRRMTPKGASAAHTGFDLHLFVKVLARQPGKLDPRDCELLALRHVLGMPIANIAQLLRMQSNEVANRLAWALERVFKLGGCPSAETAENSPDLALSA